MNESERLQQLEQEIEKLKSQLNQGNRYYPVKKPWEIIHSYIEVETSKRYQPRTRDFWHYYEAVRGCVKVSMNLSNVRNLTDEQVDLALKKAEEIIKAMETTLVIF